MPLFANVFNHSSVVTSALPKMKKPNVSTGPPTSTLLMCYEGTIVVVVTSVSTAWSFPDPFLLYIFLLLLLLHLLLYHSSAKSFSAPSSDTSFPASSSSKSFPHFSLLHLFLLFSSASSFPPHFP